MPNFPSIYLELQELWKRIRGLDETSLEIKQKLQCISRVEVPSTSTVVNCDLRVSGSGNPNLYVGPLAQDSTTGSNAELIIVGRQNDAYVSTWDGTARTVIGSTNGIGYVGTQTDDNFTIRQDNDPVVTVKKQSGDNRIVTVSGSMEITGSLNNGDSCLTSHEFSHAEGHNTTAAGSYSHAEGENTTTFESAYASHAEGVHTIVIQQGGHAEGLYTKAGAYCHSEGQYTTASILSSHAEGSGSVANGNACHVEGVLCYAEGIGSHAEGYHSTASGDYSHAEGYFCRATNTGSHAEGELTLASGKYSHTIGYGTVASGNYSFAAGDNTIASGNYQFVAGAYNDTNTTALVIIGNGIINNRSNVLEIYDDNISINENIQLKSGNGINFGVLNPISNPDVTSVTLDDYEEGTWTPLTSSGLTGVSVTSGSYVKVGNLVHMTGLLKTTTAITASVGDFITGFPYTPDNNSIDSSPVLFTNHSITSRASISNGYLYGSGSTPWFDRLYTPSFTSTDDIKFSCTYKTS